MIRFLTFPVFLMAVATAIIFGSTANAVAAPAKVPAAKAVAIEFSAPAMKVGDSGWLKVKIGSECKRRTLVMEQSFNGAPWAEMLRLKVPTGNAFEYSFTPVAAGDMAYRIKVLTKNCSTKVAKRTFSAA